jgi:hypothetical protein
MAEFGGSASATTTTTTAYDAVITADEVNLLVYRYLEESSLRHSAFVFANEYACLPAAPALTLLAQIALG